MTAETKMQAAAEALRQFAAMRRPFDAASYLECEPADGEDLRVHHVTGWLETTDGRAFSSARGFTPSSWPAIGIAG